MHLCYIKLPSVTVIIKKEKKTVVISISQMSVVNMVATTQLYVMVVIPKAMALIALYIIMHDIGLHHGVNGSNSL